MFDVGSTSCNRNLMSIRFWEHIARYNWAVLVLKVGPIVLETKMSFHSGNNGERVIKRLHLSQMFHHFVNFVWGHIHRWRYLISQRHGKTVETTFNNTTFSLYIWKQYKLWDDTFHLLSHGTNSMPEPRQSLQHKISESFFWWIGFTERLSVECLPQYWQSGDKSSQNSCEKEIDTSHW